MAKFEALKFTKECAEQAFAKETSRKLSVSVENFNDPTQRLTSLGPRHVCQDLIFAARTVRERLFYEVQRTKSYSIGWVGKSKMATAIMLWHQLYVSLLATQRPRLYFFHLRKVRHFTLKAGFSAKRGGCGNFGGQCCMGRQWITIS